MFKRRGRHHPPARGALEEAELQQKWLDGFLNRIPRFGKCRSNGFDTHRPTIVSTAS